MFNKKPKKLYKFLREGLKSEHGNCTWTVGEWKKEEDISLCNRGFHASKTPLQAFGYVSGEILTEVEVRGKNQKEDDKEVWEKMRITKAWKWQKKDSVALSIYSAELCIENFEKVFPDDKRPREAIEAARKWLVEPTKENESAAESAARSAAESAARSAAESAARSARSAESAAWSAARSAESAARSARSAAYKTLTKKIDAWFIKRLKVLEKYDKQS